MSSIDDSITKKRKIINPKKNNTPFLTPPQ